MVALCGCNTIIEKLQVNGSHGVYNVVLANEYVVTEVWVATMPLQKR